MHTSAPTLAIILDTAVKSTVLLGFAWGAALALKKSSAATQHLVRTFALAALLLLPFSVIFLPAWHVKGVPQFFSPSPAAHSVATNLATLPSSVPAVQEGPLAASSRHTAPVAAPLRRQFKPEPTIAANGIAANAKDRIATSASPGVAALTMNPPAASRGDAASGSFRNSVSRRLPQVLIALWIAGALFFLARWRLNTMRLAALVRRAAVLTDSGWNAQVRALSADLGIDRHVALLVSDEIEVPITTGVMFPRVVLSLDYPEWSATRRAAILNHELAHIKRLDALTQALANVATSLYWFHPLVWLMARAMRVERERACDDHVLAAGTKASDYAHELLDIVSGLREPELAAALAMARRSQLEGRVLAVLNPALPRGSVSRRAALVFAALTLGVVLPLSALRPAQQAATPAAKSTQKKPSPASTPAIAPHANDSATPGAAASTQIGRASCRER